MVNNTIRTMSSSPRAISAISAILRVYLAVSVATLGALAALTALAPHEAPQEAWVHAVIVAAFAVLLLVRARSARQGSVGALRAVGVIASVLLLANVVEALVPGFVPMWMRVEMIGIAALMAVVVALVVRERV